MVSGAGCLKKVWCPLEPHHPVNHPSVIIGSSNVMDHFNTVKQRKYLQQTEKKTHSRKQIIQSSFLSRQGDIQFVFSFCQLMHCVLQHSYSISYQGFVLTKSS